MGRGVRTGGPACRRMDDPSRGEKGRHAQHGACAWRNDDGRVTEHGRV
nr:hypothetical protein RVX_3284 [Nitratidesulfovibrio sp. HK-II]